MPSRHHSTTPWALLLGCLLVIPQAGVAQNIEFNPIEPAHTLMAPTAGGRTGSDIATADLNGDGILDYVVGSPKERGGGMYIGRVYIQFGPLVGEVIDLGSADGVIEGEEGALYTGERIALMEDVNGDGLPELMVSTALMYEDDPGAVQIHYSPHHGVRRVTDSQASVRNTRALVAEFSSRLDSLGDLNQDGHEDYLFTASVVGGVGSENYVVYGPITQDLLLPEDAAATFTAASLSTLSPAGDVNGDGVPDLILATPFSGVTGLGGAHLYYGPLSAKRYSERDADARIIHQLGDRDCDDFGCQYSTDLVGRFAQGVGDVNADGFDDVILSAETEKASTADGQTEEQLGAAYLFFGPLEGTHSLSSADIAFKGDGGLFGGFPHARDLNGDGIQDLILMAANYWFQDGYRGALYAYYGPLNQSVYQVNEADFALSSWGDAGTIQSPHSLPDSDGDGISELLLTAPHLGTLGSYQSSFYGRVYIIESRSWR